MGCSESKVYDEKIPGESPVLTNCPTIREVSKNTLTQDGSILPHYLLDDIVNANVDAEGQIIDATRRSPRVRTFKVMLTGLESAGKSRLLYTLLMGPEPSEEPCKTEGFHEETLYVTAGGDRHARVNFHVHDLGGEAANREALLPQVMPGCMGLIFAVPASATQEECEEAREWLRAVIGHEASYYRNQPIPVLLLATKSDLPGSRTPAELAAIVMDPVLRGRDTRRRHTVVSTSVFDEADHLQASIGFNCLAYHMAEMCAEVRNAEAVFTTNEAAAEGYTPGARAAAAAATT